MSCITSRSSAASSKRSSLAVQSSHADTAALPARPERPRASHTSGGARRPAARVLSIRRRHANRDNGESGAYFKFYYYYSTRKVVLRPHVTVGVIL
eukprot:scaffold261681_cov35-Tisochrysis_lutea.AAC.3